MDNFEDEEASGGASVRFEQNRDLAVVEAWDEIDLSVVPQFKSVLDTALEAAVAVIVDLSRVNYIDSSGFGTLLETSRAARAIGVTVYLAACNTNISRMLEVTRLNTIFNITPDVASARELAGALPTAATAAAV